MALRSDFRRVARKLDDRLDLAMRLAANDIADGAKGRVPIATGRLRDAIHVEKLTDGNYKVIAGNTQAWYGHIIEHGSTTSPPHPFLTPAAEAVLATLHERLRRTGRTL